MADRIECWDYSARVWLRYKGSQTDEQDYSNKPPSNWASTSRCTQLYGPITCRLVKPAS